MMSRTRRFIAGWILPIVSVSLVGCSSLPSTHIVAFGTPYYLDGPDQPGAPDGFLKRGDKVWVMRKKNSYSHLFHEDGTLSWVWSPSLMEARAFAKEEKIRQKERGGSETQFRAK